MNKLKAIVTARAIELEAKLDTKLFGVYRDPATGKYLNEDGSEATAGSFKSVGGAVKAVAAGGAIGGAVLGGKALAGRYGADQATSPSKAAMAIGRGVGRDVTDAAKSGARKSLLPVANALDNLSQRANRVAGVTAQSAVKNRGLRRTLGLIGKAALRPVAMSEVVKGRLIELSDKVDDMIEFGSGEEVATALLGSPTVAAYKARKGKKWDAAKEAYGNTLVDTTIGATSGAVGGAGLGIAALKTKAGRRIAARVGNVARFPRGRGRLAAAAAATGAVAGLYGGAISGKVHGEHSKKAREIRSRYV